MTEHDKLKISYSRLLGEFTGYLEGIQFYDIPQELKVKLKNKVKELRSKEL